MLKFIFNLVNIFQNVLFLRYQTGAIVFEKTKYFINTSFIVHLKRFLVLLKVTLLEEKLKGVENVLFKKFAGR
jgi:hypothetical protein